MIHAKSESDVASLGGSTSSSSSPKQNPSYYYVQSPSRDSHDDVDNKSSTNSRSTPLYSSPMESPSHPSQSRPSSASRVSGPYRAFSLGGKHPDRRLIRKKNHQRGWPPLFSVIDEEDDRDYEYDKYYDEQQFMRRCRILLLFMAVVMVFTVVCFVTWGVSRRYRFEVQVKRWRVNNFYYGEGTDGTGVPTKLLTLNVTVTMNIRNPATFFDIHVSCSSLNLFYSLVLVGSGHFMDYYQPKRSQRTVSLNLEGSKVPLYGARPGFIMDSDNGTVPLKLEFEIRSQANLIGGLVKTKHRRDVTCVMEIDSRSTNAVNIKQDSCLYN